MGRPAGAATQSVRGAQGQGPQLVSAVIATLFEPLPSARGEPRDHRFDPETARDLLETSEKSDLTRPGLCDKVTARRAVENQGQQWRVNQPRSDRGRQNATGQTCPIGLL